MMVVDASVWVSRFIPQDDHHTTSRLWLNQQIIQGTEIVVPILVLSEVTGPVVRRLGKPRLAHQAMAIMLAISKLRLEAIDTLLGHLAAEIATDLALCGADAVYVALAYHLQLPLVTWDSEQRTRGRRLITVMTP